MSLLSILSAVLLALACLASTFPATSAQDIIQEGTLINGVGVTVPIDQGDSHYWNFPVTADDPNSGSVYTELILTLTDTEGSCSLYVTDSANVRYSSQLTRVNGLLFTNQTDVTGAVRAGATAAVKYGLYTIQIYGVSSDTYTLSATLIQRTVLTNGTAVQLQAPVVTNNGTLTQAVNLDGALNQFAQYTVNTAGPVQLAVSMTIDDAALIAAGIPLSAVLLPILTWSTSVDVTPWSLNANSVPGTKWRSSNAAAAQPQSFSLTESFSECSTPPCVYSFLIAPQMALPVFPTISITHINVDSPPFRAIEDYATSSGTGNGGIGGTITYVLPSQSIGAGILHFWTFTILDLAVLTTLTLTTPSPNSNIQMFISRDNVFPDATSGGSTWTLGQSPGVSQSSLVISPSDSYFATGTAAALTMEGLYHVAVFGQAGGSYAMMLNMVDQTNSTAPVIDVNVVYSATLQPGVAMTYRFVTPRGFDTDHTDLIFTANNVSLYVSDLTTTPGPSSPYNIAGTVISNTLSLAMMLIQRDTAQLHSGIYYVAVYNSRNVPISYSLSASFTLHSRLAINSTFISEDPLLPGQLRFFDFVQPSATTMNIEFLLATVDPNAYGTVFINVATLATPFATSALAYPLPGTQSNSQTVISGDGSVTGDQYGNFTYSCPGNVYLCLWQVTLYAPPANVLGLMNYSLAVTAMSATSVVIPLTSGVPYNGVRTNGQATPPTFTFPINSFSQVNITVNYTSAMNGATSFRMLVTRNPSGIFFGNGAEFTANAARVNGTNTTYSLSLAFNPTSTVFKPANTANNIGSSQLGPWYVMVYCDQCRGAPGSLNYTLLVTWYDYTATLNLTSQVLTAGTTVSQTIPGTTYGFYRYTATSGSNDIILAALTLNAQQRFFWIYASRTEFPSSTVFGYGTPAANNPQSLIFASETTQLQAGDVIYFAIFNGNGQSMNVNLTLSDTTRRVLTTGSLPFSYSQYIAPGSVQLFDLVLPGPTDPTQFVSNSFVASVSLSPSDIAAATAPPLMQVTSYRRTTDAVSLPALSGIRSAGITYGPRGNGSYTGGDYIQRSNDLCSMPTGQCLYHVLVWFPQSVSQGYTFAVSSLNTTTGGAPSSYQTTLIPANYSAQFTIAQGEVQNFNFTIPTALLTTAIVNVIVTPVTGNPDLTVAATRANAGLALLNSNQAPAFALTGRLQSYQPGSSVDSVAWNASVAAFAINGVLAQNYWISVTGTVAGSYRLDVVTTAAPQNVSAARPLVIDSSLSNTTASGRITNGNPVVYAIQLPSTISATTDLFVTLFSAQGNNAQAGNPSGNNGGAVQFAACLDIYPASAALAAALPIAVCVAPASTSSSRAWVFNANTSPPLKPGSILYIAVIQGSPYTLVTSFKERLSFKLGDVASGVLQPGQLQAITLTVPAVQVSGQWSTNANFIAAVTAASTAVKPAANLLLTLAANPRTPLPYGSGVADRWSVQPQAAQSLTVSDLCLTSSCVYTAIIYVPSNSPLNYTFTFQLLTAAYSKLTPGFSTGPTYIATDAFSYYTFTLPHPSMAATVTLQSLVTGAYANYSANADLFAAYRFTRPDHNNNDQNSQIDNSFGTDTVTFNFLTSNTQANRTFYVSVFGQRAGYYTLSVVAQDPAPAPSFITNNEPLISLIAPMTSDYYQYNIGQVSNATDLSIILTSSTPTPTMYATFSYTHPGPILPSGYLPASLPYEMYSRVPALLSEPNWQGRPGLSNVYVQQITLTSTMSSSNVLPLQSQSSLYTAVFGGSSVGSITPYALSVSLSKRITLVPSSTLTSSATMTRVSGGTVQYFETSWTPASLAAGSGAIIAITGQLSDALALPFVYLTDPTLSSQVDPVMSSTRSYSIALNASAPGSNSRMADASNLCPLSTFTCLWKVLVYSALDTAGYTLTVNTYKANDQVAVTSGTTASDFVEAGRFKFYTVDLIPSQSLLVNLTTLNTQGNVDLYMSQSNGHPSAYTATWSSVNSGNVSDVLSFATGGKYYIAVFGQRTSQFSLVVNPSASSGNGDSSSSSTSSGVIAAAVIVPIIVVILIALVAFWCLRRRPYSKTSSPRASPRTYGSENSVTSPHSDAPWSEHVDEDGDDAKAVEMSSTNV